jgi:hypothetical protein
MEAQTDIVERLRIQYPDAGMIPRPLIIEEAARLLNGCGAFLDRYRLRHFGLLGRLGQFAGAPKAFPFAPAKSGPNPLFPCPTR